MDGSIMNALHGRRPRCGRRAKQALFFAATSVATMAATQTARADTSWISTSSQLWSTSTNWSAGLPSSGPQLEIHTDSASIQHTIDIAGTARVNLGMRFDLTTGGSGFRFMTTTATGNLFKPRAVGSGDNILNNDDNTQQFDVAYQVLTAAGGPGGAQTWHAAAGDLLFTGVNGTSTLPTLDLNTGSITLNTDTGRTITIGTTGRGDIASVAVGGSQQVTKSGNGSLVLGGTVANSFAGTFLMNAGTVVANKANALGSGTTSLISGTISIGANNQTVGQVAISGGTLTGSTGTVTGTAYNLQAGYIGAKLGGSGIVLTKSGAGVGTLAAANTYTGATNITGGTLHITSAGSVTSNITVGASGTLAGSGTTTGTVDVSGKISPGASAGTLHTGSENWNGGGSYDFDLVDATTPSSNDEMLLDQGSTAVNIVATSGNKFTVFVKGAGANFDNSTAGSWILADANNDLQVGGTSVTDISQFDPAAFAIDTTNFIPSLNGGSFSVGLDLVNKDVLLDFTPASAPEPGTAGLLLVGGMATLLRRRRRGSKS